MKIGYFDDPKDAALAIDCKLREWGEISLINFKTEEEKWGRLKEFQTIEAEYSKYCERKF